MKSCHHLLSALALSFSKGLSFVFSAAFASVSAAFASVSAAFASFVSAAFASFASAAFASFASVAFASVAFASVGLVGCQDTDLDGSQVNGGSEASQETEATWRRECAMRCLLGVVSERDSLPEGWQDSTFQATLGEAQSAADPGVRLVATSSAAEACRFYKSMVSESFSGVAADDFWEMDGVGSLTFRVKNEAGLYASLEVAVKQLPGLREVRFVPASALGKNTAEVEPYYTFGDIILQQREGEVPTYWVCVRPCSKDGAYEKSHWCSLQLNGLEQTKPNFKVFTPKSGQKQTLPTDLGGNEGDSRRMVQNYLNVLRLMVRPELYANADGLGEISREVFTEKLVRRASYAWNDQDLWQYVVKDNEAVRSSLKEGVAKDNAKFCLFHYGYTSNYSLLSARTYNVYPLWISTGTGNIQTDLFSSTEVATCKVDPSQVSTDFSRINGLGKMPFDLTEDIYQGLENAYVVKYRTGAQLENLWGWNDAKPGTSFQDRTTKNKITDVFVQRNLKNLSLEENGYNKDESHSYSPFFAFGDEVTSKQTGNKCFCVRGSLARSSTDIDNEDKTSALFLTMDNKGCGSILEDQAVYVSVLLLDSYIKQQNDAKNLLELSNDENIEAAFERGLTALKDFITSGRISFQKSGTSYLLMAPYKLNCVTVLVTDENGHLTTKTIETVKILTLEYNTTSNELTYKLSDTESRDFLGVEVYTDVNSLDEDFSTSRELMTLGKVRSSLKEALRTRLWNVSKAGAAAKAVDAAALR